MTMFKIGKADKVNLTGNRTSGKDMLDADDIRSFKANDNRAGNPVEYAASEARNFGWWRDNAILLIVTGVVAGLVVVVAGAYLIHHYFPSLK